MRLPIYLAASPEENSTNQVVDSAIRWTDKVWDKISDADMWLNIMFSSIRILIILLLRVS